MGTAGSRRKIRKNDREKRRRQELNEKFDVLMDMLNMNNDKGRLGWGASERSVPRANRPLWTQPRSSSS